MLSEDSLWRLAQREAQALDAQQVQAICDVALLPEPEYAIPADLYNAAAVEFVVMTDGIGSRHRSRRESRPGRPSVPKRRSAPTRTC